MNLSAFKRVIRMAESDPEACAVVVDIAVYGRPHNVSAVARAVELGLVDVRHGALYLWPSGEMVAAVLRHWNGDPE